MIFNIDTSIKMPLEEGRISDKLRNASSKALDKGVKMYDKMDNAMDRAFKPLIKYKNERNRKKPVPESDAQFIKRKFPEIKTKAQRGELKGFTYRGFDFSNYDKYLKYFSKLAKNQFIFDDFDTEEIWRNDAEKNRVFTNARKKLLYGTGCATPNDVNGVRNAVHKYLCGKEKDLTYDDFVRIYNYDDDGWNSIDEMYIQFVSATQANPDHVTDQGYEYAHYKINCCNYAYDGIEDACDTMCKQLKDMTNKMLAYKSQNEVACAVDSIFDQIIY